MLYICGTPIGNIEDITIRVLNILKSVDIIACEDTRQTLKLLNKYEIKATLTSYHEHNKEEKGLRLIEKLREGADIALVSDAGMPGISDPGELLIKQCIEEDIPYTVVPGATAAVTALVLSGFSSRSYCFEGFLPKNKKYREHIFNRLLSEERTSILYEAPHHLCDTLKELADIMGQRRAVCARELTKKHETLTRGTLSELYDYFSRNEPRGEFVIVIEGAELSETEGDTDILSLFSGYISKGMSEKDAMKQTAKDMGVGKREVYAAVKLGNENDL